MIKNIFLKVSAALFLGLMLSFFLQATAQGHGTRERGEGSVPQISAEKREAIRACTASKGFEMPAKRLQREERHAASPSELTQEQREIMDSCFEAHDVAPFPMMYDTDTMYDMMGEDMNEHMDEMHDRMMGGTHSGMMGDRY